MNARCLPRNCALYVAIAMALASPFAVAGFQLVEGAAQPLLVPQVALPAPGDTKSTEVLRQEIYRLNQELAQMRAQLLAAQADAAASRQDLLVLRAKQDQIQESINQITVNFAFGHSTFEPSALEADAIVAAAKAAFNVKVIGYTDSLGSLEANKKVASLRAQAGKMFLVRKGVAASKITAEGRTGEYVAPNTNENGRSANRRVVFQFSNE